MVEGDPAIVVVVVVLDLFIPYEVEAEQQVLPTLISSQLIYRAEKVHIIIVLSGVLGTGNRDL